MVNLLNRREIIVTRDFNILNNIIGLLDKNSIEHNTKTNSITNSGRSHGIPNVKADASYEYRIYVRRCDYEKAIRIIK